MIRKSMSLSGVALLLLACEREAPAPAPQAPPAPPQETTAVAPKAPETSVDLDSIAVEEDFEQEAETRVNAANLEATLDELEKEIDRQ